MKLIHKKKYAKNKHARKFKAKNLHLSLDHKGKKHVRKLKFKR